MVQELWDTSIPDPPSYRVEVVDLVLKCDEAKFAIDNSEFWSASNELVNLLVVEPAVMKFSEFQIGSRSIHRSKFFVIKCTVASVSDRVHKRFDWRHRGF